MHACLCAWKASQSGFNLPRSLVKLVQVNLNVRKDLERSFLQSGGLLMLVQTCLCSWKSHKAFSTSRDAVKHVQVYLSVRKELERSFHHCGGPVMLV